VSFKQALLGSARQLADGIRQLAGELDRVRKNATQGLADALNEANTLAPQLAEINVRIRGSSAPGVTPTPEILDERDRLTSRLQELVGGTTRITPTGTAVFSLGGMILVDEANANSFTTREGLKPIPGGVEPTDLRLQIATDKNRNPILTPLVLPSSIQSVDNRPVAVGSNLTPSQFLNSGVAGGYLSVLAEFLPENERMLDLLAGKLLFDVNKTKGVDGAATSPLFELRSALDGSANDSPSSLNDIFLKADGSEYTFDELLSRTHPKARITMSRSQRSSAIWSMPDHFMRRRISVALTKSPSMQLPQSHWRVCALDSRAHLRPTYPLLRQLSLDGLERALRMRRYSAV
jgi:flagellar hook-associated protein FlgK